MKTIDPQKTGVTLSVLFSILGVAIIGAWNAWELRNDVKTIKAEMYSRSEMREWSDTVRKDNPQLNIPWVPIDRKVNASTPNSDSYVLKAP